MSEEERLKAEIAKLSGAIQTHKDHQHQQPYRPPYNSGYAPRGRGYYSNTGPSTYRGAYAGTRGGYHATTSAGRGRGRGAATIPPRNRTLVLNDSKAKATNDGSSGTSTSADANGDPSKPDEASASVSAPTEGWVKRKTTHNMSLVSASTFQRTEPARLAALEATRKAKAEAKAASSASAHAKKTARGKSTKPSSSVRRGDNMGEVVIDGVVFEFDPSGTKLVKKAVQPSSSIDNGTDNASSTSTPSDPSSSSAAVPLKTNINGQDYIRTKRGNLISADLLAKRRAQREAQAKMGRLDKMVGQISAIQATRNASSRTKPGSGSRTLDANKARTLCTFFNKTGQCKRGLSCPYLHDSSKIALCPKVLRPSGCTLPKGTCPLSHTPRAERVPHCVHYLRTGKCRNGEDCLYTHSDKLAEGTATKICRDFSDYGWCERGKDCEERHTYECPDFVEKGRCDRKGCKLVHVIRASTTNKDGEGAEKEGEEDQAGQQGDADLFMRDDAAANQDSEEESEQKTGGKRKRPLMQTELDDDQQVLPDDADAGEEEDEDEQVNFADHGDSRRAKRRKAKAFTQQKDFISFDYEEDDEEEGDEESEDQEFSEDEGGNDEHLEVGSVHSEDFELSDAEGDEHEAEQAGQTEEDESEDEDEQANERDETSDPTAQYQDEDEDGDDDLVDRDL